MTLWSTDRDAETARRLAAQERELARLRAELAAWRAAAAVLPNRTDTDFTSVSGHAVGPVYTPLDLAPDLQAATGLLDANQFWNPAQIDDITRAAQPILEPVHAVESAAEHPVVVAVLVGEPHGVVDRRRLKELERRDDVANNRHIVLPLR